MFFIFSTSQKIFFIQMIGERRRDIHIQTKNFSLFYYPYRQDFLKKRIQSTGKSTFPVMSCRFMPIKSPLFSG